MNGRVEITKVDEQFEQALRMLRAIRQRYAAGRNLGYGRAYTVQVALGYSDMLWITAAIEALEKVSATSAALSPSVSLRAS